MYLLHKFAHAHICISKCRFTIVKAAKKGRCWIGGHSGWGTGRTWMIRNGPQGNRSEKRRDISFCCKTQFGRGLIIRRKAWMLLMMSGWRPPPPCLLRREKDMGESGSYRFPPKYFQRLAFSDVVSKYLPNILFRVNK